MKPAPTVLVNGCFDGLHPGHLFLLGYARALAGPAGRLIVGINSDSYIRKRKAREPHYAARRRKAALLALGIVDQVVVFGGDPSGLVELYAPDIYVLGAEYRDTYLAREACRTTGTQVVFIPRVGNWASRLGPKGCCE